MWKFLAGTAVCLLFTAFGGLNTQSCPEKNGRWPDAKQCDKYLECRDGEAKELLCPEGLLFNDKASLFSYPCGYPTEVQCGGRSLLQPAEPSEECPHQFGIYRLGDQRACGQFMSCVGGRSFVFDCPEGLAFNSETYQCDWPDLVDDCDAEAYIGFKCPPLPEGFGPAEFMSYPNPSDCQRYFICVDGRPRLHSCGEDFAFNPLTKLCDGRENVTGC